MKAMKAIKMGIRIGISKRIRKMAGITIVCLSLAGLFAIAGCSEKRAGLEERTASKEKDNVSRKSESSETDVIETYKIDIDKDDCRNVEDELDFIDCMVRQAKCTVADAVRAVCMLEAGEDIGKNYRERYEYLKERGIVRDAWHLKPDQWIDRGTLAYMLLKAAHIKGGINMFLFASWGLGDRRYAYREMLYRDLMEEGVSYNYVSGPELITAIGNVDRYMEQAGEYSPQEKLELGNRSQYETGNIRIPRKKTQKRSN